MSFACSQIKEYSVIVIPYNTPQNKIQKICNNGAKIICVETLDTYDKCVDYAVSYAKKNNFLYVPSFDDWDIIDGHKNLFREISSVQTDFSKIYCQIGGGGLISALITTDYFDKKTVCGVELENEDAMRQSMLRNEIVEIPISKGGSFCEGVTVSKIGRIPFSNIVSKNIMIETVSAEDVVNAIRFLFEYGIKAEGAGALGVARYLKSDITQSKVLCIISGGNINDDLFKEMIQG